MTEQEKTGVAQQRNRRQRIGVVRSDKMDKTITVESMRRFPHPVYKKIIKRKVVFKAHDEKNAAKIGDRVRVIETRPLSKTKRWRLVEVLGE